MLQTTKAYFKNQIKSFFSPRTIGMIRFDLARAKARRHRQKHLGTPACNKLHFGCGNRRIPGWVNLDLANADVCWDISTGTLPWGPNVFSHAMSQHVIEHLDIETELLPLLKDLHRVLEPNGNLWLSCPDMEKICHSYCSNKMQDLIDDRKKRAKAVWGMDWSLDKVNTIPNSPSSSMFNSIVYQGFEHKNIFDFDLLSWLLNYAGFNSVKRISEADLQAEFLEIPQRLDDAQTLYVVASK
jgi:predicted SAM-dependent methyltransferase